MSRRPKKEDLAKRVQELEEEVRNLRNAAGEHEEKHRRIMDSIEEGYYELDMKGNIVSFNRAAGSLLGFEPHEVLGMSYRNYTSPETARRMYEVFHRIYETGNPERLVDYEVTCKDGSVRVHEMSAGSMRDEAGKAIGFHVLVHDVTARKQAEKNLKRSEERYRNILESMEEAYFELDLRGAYTFANPAVGRILGYDQDEIIGLNYRSYVSPETAQRMFDVFNRIYRTGNPELLVDYEVIRKDGSVRVNEMNAAPLRDATGNIVGFRGVGRDITERKKAETNLSRSEERYRSILESMEEAYYEVDLKGNFTFFNSRAVNRLGYTVEELSGMNYRQYMEEEAAQKVHNAFHQVFLNGEPVTGFAWELKNKQGHPIFVEASISLRRDADGSPVGFFGVVRDITERKKAEEALRASEEKYRGILQSMQESYFELDLKGNFTFFNDTAVARWGYSREELLGMNYRQYSPPETVKRLYDVFHRVYLTGKPELIVDNDVIHKDGALRDNEMSVWPMRDASGAIVGFHALVRDVTERKRAERAIRESEERFRDLARLLPETVFETDLNGRFTFVNEISLERFGYTPQDVERGVSILNVMAPHDHDRVIRNCERVMKGERLGLSEYTARKKDGTTFPALVHTTSIYRDGRQAGLRGFLIDITEKKSLEEQLMRAQKLEAIGTLAGGIAHDFNNLLMGILGNISLMLMHFDETHPFHDRLKSMEDYVRRGSDLTKQLLGFARGGKYEVKPTDLGEFVRRSAEMFGRAKKEIRMHHKASQDLWVVEVDRGQMEQVMLNLFVNAWQAMPSGGDLYLSVENVELDADEVRPYGIGPGRFVKVMVTDTGVGMDEATKTRIFEPFFSTKERGRGTGLGLASVYGIIKNHGGFILVESEKDIGTSFMVYLPASEKIIEHENRTHDQVHRGRETVLIIDDEEMIVEVGARMLEALGYSVMTATGGRQGLQIFDQNRGAIDLVILDMIMPDFGGKETFEALRRQDPNVRVLLSSGYSLDGQAKDIMAGGCKGFIQKPFTMAELSKKIRQILEED